MQIHITFHGNLTATAKTWALDFVLGTPYGLRKVLEGVKAGNAMYPGFFEALAWCPIPSHLFPHHRPSLARSFRGFLVMEIMNERGACGSRR